MPIDVQIGQDRSLIITLKDLNKGLDSQSEPTETAPDFVPDLQNMTTQGGYPSGMPGSTLHTAGFIAPDAAAPQMLASFTTVAGTFYYLMACQNGHVYSSVDNGANWVSRRRGLTTGATAWWSHTAVDEYFVMGNGTDANQKFDGTRLLPVGAKHIFDAESGEATWTGGSAETTATYLKQGVQSRKITATAGGTTSVTLAPATAWNLTSGLLAAVDYAVTDYIDFWVYIDTLANLAQATSYIRFGNVADTNYYQLVASSWGTLAAGWNKVHVLKSAFAVGAGAPDWASIAKMTLFIDAGAGVDVNCWFDDCYMIYATVMPACQVVREHKNMLLGGKGADIYYSAVGGPDQFDTVDTSVVVLPPAGGTAATVTGMHEYADYLLVTTDNAVHSLHVQFRNLLYPDYDITRQEVTTEHGCTSHRSMVMAAGRVWMHWRNNLHAFAGIGTVKSSEIVDPTLADIEPTRAAYVVGGRLHDANQIYWWWTPAGGTQNTSGIAYNAVQQAFLPIVGQSVALAETVTQGGVEYLLTPGYTGRVPHQHEGTTWDGTAITRHLTLPWLSAGRPHPVVSWRRFILPYDHQASGSLVVSARTADHPEDFDSAAFATIGTFDMSQSINWGGSRFHLRSAWIQFKLTTVGAQVATFWPITVRGMVLWGRG